MLLSETILDEFEKFKNNAFLVYGAGIGSVTLAYQFLKRYASYTTLTLIIDMNVSDCEYLQRELEKSKFKFNIDFNVTTNKVQKKRVPIYLKGGVIFTTSRILLMDMLCSYISPHLIDNLMILKGERFDKGSINFLLYLLKENYDVHKQPKKLLIASNKPHILTDKFNKIFPSTFVKTMMFWPFNKSRKVDSKKKKDNLIVFNDGFFKFSGTEKLIQDNIKILMSKLESRIKQKYDVTVETVSRFDIQKYEFAIANAIKDYKALRQLLYYLCEYSNLNFYIHFHSFVEELSDSFYDLVSSNSEIIGIIDKECFNKLFKISKKGNEESFIVNIESSAKMNMIEDIFNALNEEMKDFDKDEIANVLIITGSLYKAETVKNKLFLKYKYSKTNELLVIYQLMELLSKKRFKNISKSNFIPKPLKNHLELLKQYLTNTVCQLNKENMELSIDLIPVLREEEERGFFDDDFEEDEEFDDKTPHTVNNESNNLDKEVERPQKRIRLDKEEIERVKGIVENSFKILIDQQQIAYDFKLDIEDELYTAEEFKTSIFKQLRVTFDSTDYSDSQGKRFSILNKHKPEYVLFYDMCNEFSRELELFSDNVISYDKTGKEYMMDGPRSVWTIVLENSIQSDRVFKKIEKERIGFEKVINAFVDKLKENGEFIFKEREVNKGIIYVDKREFSSNLPFTMYKHGFNVQPVMLPVADYILGDNICVERKDCATGDFYQSLKSGRIIKQINNMKKYFYINYLFVENYEKSLYNISNDIAKLRRKFWALKIVFSKDEEYTCELFEKIKKGKEDPNVKKMKFKLSKH